MTLTRGCGEPLGRSARVSLDGLANGDGAQSNFGRRDFRAGDGQHQRSRVAEVAVELDWPGPARQLRVQLVHLQIDVAELFRLVLHVVGELDVNDRQAGEAERANAEIRRAVGPDGRVLRGRLLHGTRDQLLDLLRRSSRPLALRRRDAHRDVGVLPLGHVMVAVPSPKEGRDQQDHRTPDGAR